MKSFIRILMVVSHFSEGLHAESDLVSSVHQSIAKGIAFLEFKQDPTEGFWEFAQEPALSALVIVAIMNQPDRAAQSVLPAADKGYAFLLKNMKPNGGIYTRGRANYNTSVSLMALALRGRPEDDQLIRQARKFLVGQQDDYGQKGKADNPTDGGFGYGNSRPDNPAHGDLSNTQFTLEALYLSQKLLEDSGKPVDKKDDLNWSAAIQFVSRCQNLPGSNDESWAGLEKATIGGFVYVPAEPKSAKDKVPAQGESTGRTPMRCYGSISDAGMRSFIYAGLMPDDARVKAALKWLAENYTVEENPGMGAEGLFYYYHNMSRALTVAHFEHFTTKDGKTVDWTTDLAAKLLKTQNADGSWVNPVSSRWMEGEPVLATTYTVLALESLLQNLK